MNDLIKVRVIPSAKEDMVKEIGLGYFRVRVTDQPEKGKANQKVIKLLAEYFGVRQSNVVLKQGGTGRDKIFSILVKHI